MPGYEAPIEDMRFLLKHVFDFDAVMVELGMPQVDVGLAIDILTEGGKLCTDILAPLNRSGDIEGCRLDDGVVHTPQGFADA